MHKTLLIKIHDVKVRHDDRSHLGGGLRSPEQRGDGGGAGDGEPEQAGLRPGDLDLPAPPGRDIQRRHHGVHGLGPGGEAPHHYQAAHSLTTHRPATSQAGNCV